MEVADSTHAYGDVHLDILTLDTQGGTAREDALAIEEALEIRLAGSEPVITMRTPGHDRELAAGLMLSEGVAHSRDDFEVIDHLVGQPNVLQVVLKRFNTTKAERLARSSLSNSACGVCGKKKLNLEAMQGLSPLVFSSPLSRQLLTSLPGELNKQQTLFAHTGGLHAAALFDANGQLLALREDVGRHNADDKLTGWAVPVSSLFRSVLWRGYPWSALFPPRVVTPSVWQGSLASPWWGFCVTGASIFTREQSVFWVPLMPCPRA